MSFLVELDRRQYPDIALDRIAVASEFGLDNARAMMWMSQLAYETAHRAKVESILAAWRLALREFVGNDPDTHMPMRTACALVAGGRGATIVSFAGTDPLKINDWITDLWALPSPAGLHTGFATAVDRIWQPIATAIRNRTAAEDALILTGHSLGGALAIIAAERAQRELAVSPTVVYTFGSPRPGDGQFSARYPLGTATFRLVHGNDLVPTVPPSQGGFFHHVGRCIQCATGAQFDTQTPMSSPTADLPDFATSFFGGIRQEAQRFLSGRPFVPVGGGPVGQIVGLSPAQIQDHVPASYFRALSIPLN